MSRVLIITGMHRSGTSLVASHLATCGLDLGRELLAGDVGNPRGYFEDVLIHDFHRRAVERRGIKDGFTVTGDDLPVAIDGTDEAEARAIVSRFNDRPQYGWKEPRAALFLDLWAGLLPEATFLFVFRKPDAVLDSLMRRASNASVVERPVTALAMWHAHNAEMYRFWKLHPERCLWREIETYVADPDSVLHQLRDRGFELRAEGITNVLVESDLHGTVRLRARMVCRRNRSDWQRCSQLYRELRRIDAVTPSNAHAQRRAR